MKCEFCGFEQDSDKDFDKNHLNHLHYRADLFKEMVGLSYIDPADIISIGKLAQKRIADRKKKEEKKSEKKE